MASNFQDLKMKEDLTANRRAETSSFISLGRQEMSGEARAKGQPLDTSPAPLFSSILSFLSFGPTESKGQNGEKRPSLRSDNRI